MQDLRENMDVFLLAWMRCVFFMVSGNKMGKRQGDRTMGASRSSCRLGLSAGDRHCPPFLPPPGPPASEILHPC